MSESIVDEIKSGGYWRVQIRPSISDFKEDRINPNDLADIIEATKVRLRGWDFPHFAIDEVARTSKSKIYFQEKFDKHIECFEFKTNGKFVHLSSMIEDKIVTQQKIEEVKASFVFLKNRANNVTKLFEVVSTVYRFTEICLFASKLAQTNAFVDVKNFEISINLYGVNGRMLFIWDFMRELFEPYICQFGEDEIPLSKNVPREVLISEHARIAREFSIETFQSFGWKKPNESAIAIDQAKLLERRI